MEVSQTSDPHGHQSIEIPDSGVHEIVNSPRHSASPDPQLVLMDLTLNMKNEADNAENEQVVDTIQDGGQNTTDSGDHDQPQADENTDQKASDLCDPVAGQPEPLSKYKPTTNIPTFEELHQQGAVKLQDPVPGYLKFVNAFDLRGRRISTRECLDVPGQAILPSNQEPLPKQMLDYCQRWGFWIAQVQDDKRRAELLDWVGRMVQKQWQDAVDLGYCGEPNGHKYCCLAHDLDGPDGKAVKRTNQSGDARKKTINTGRQPAPFACESGKYSYSIVNQELEKCDITMNTILGRMSPEDLEKGNELLTEMCRRVERDRLIESDWKPRTGRIGFLPHIHGRNLLMFCLWEVQRCRAIIDQMNINLSKASTTFQAKTSQRRLDINQVRAGQHLALAVILDEKRDKNGSDHESGSKDSDVAIDDVPRRSDRARRSEIVIEDTDDQEDEETVVGHSESEASTSNSDDEEFDEMHLESEEAEEQTQPDGPETLTRISTNEDPAPLNAPESVNADEQNSYEVGEKRELLPSKRVKFRIGQTPTQEHHYSDVNTKFGVQNSNSALDPSFIPQNIIWPVAGRLFPPQHMAIENTTAQQMSQQSQQAHRRFSREMSSSEPTKYADLEVPEKNRMKEAYTFEFWQPRIEAVLEERGLRPLQEPLRGWGDVKFWLERLEYNGNDRNRFLREFKSGFAEWVQHQQVIITNEGSASGPTSDDQLESTRGFHFRYFTTSTEEERAHVDDMIGEYVQAIIANRTPRFGYYAVFIVDDAPGGKELAHGFWDFQKGIKAQDADWFYNHHNHHQGHARPENFRNATGPESPVIRHPWGYSIPPPAKRAVTKPKAKAAASKSVGRKRGHESENDGDYEYDYGYGSAPAHKKKQRKVSSGKADRHTSIARSGGPRRAPAPTAAAVATSRKRRGVGNDDDGDDGEWQPGH